MSVAEIRMSVRVRPTPPGEPCAVSTDPRTGALALENGDVFHYPSSVVVGSDQEVAYDALCAPLVRHALAGYDCTLVAYGQTGSGKTHTMFGPPGCLVEARVRRWREACSSSGSPGSRAPRDWGVFPRAVLELMHADGVRSIRASAVEVYHENVFDLMNGREQLSLGSSKTKFGRRARGATESGSDDVAALGSGRGGIHPSCCTCRACFALAEKEKKAKPRRETFDAVGETFARLETPECLARFARSVEATRTSKSHLLNDRSSRSHCLVTVRVKTADGASARLTFADLAGSERVARTGAEGDAKREAQAINGSLSALGRVVRALGEIRADKERSKTSSPTAAFRSTNKTKPHRHVPYRDASLTMLLRDAFGGGSRTSVVINVAGEAVHADETACSLRFGERMAVVRNAPVRVLGDANERAYHAGVGSSARVAASSAARDERLARLRRELASATAELASLARRGDAGGFVKGGPVTEVRSLRLGMEKLEAADASSAKLRVRLAELEGDASAREEGPAGRRDEKVAAEKTRVALAASAKQAEVLRAVVERQKTIKAIWAEPTPLYARKAAEVRQIRSELEMEME